MLCPKCNKYLRMKVNLFLDIPASLERKLSKKALRTKQVIVDGAGWDTVLYYCENSKCGYMLNLKTKKIQKKKRVQKKKKQYSQISSDIRTDYPSPTVDLN